MGKKLDREVQRLENHLIADDARQVSSARAYNRDKADVDLEKYSETVRVGKKRGCIWFFIFLLCAALGIFLYFVWGGQLPWK